MEQQQATTAAAIETEVDGNRLQLLTLGSERLAAIVDLIDGAKSDLRLLFYMFADDACGRTVLAALVRAAERGVEVRLLLDCFGSGDPDEEFFKPLEDAGGCTCVFHPRWGRRYLIRNHQKMAIADKRRALIGGSNISEHYLTDSGRKHWRDLWLSLEGPAAGRLADYYDDIEEWTRKPRQKIRELDHIISRHSQHRSKVAWRYSGPLRRHNPWLAQIIRDFGEACRVDIVAAYFSPPNSMLRRLWKVAARGGLVRVVTAARSDNGTTIAASRFTYGRLLKRGVQIHEYQPARLHTKLYIADDIVHIGSANFDFRSLYLNLEIMLRIEDRGFAEALRAYVDGEIAHSKQVTLKEHRERATVARKIKWAIAHFMVTTIDYTVTRRANFGLE